jgi:hypothetical protein
MKKLLSKIRYIIFYIIHPFLVLSGEISVPWSIKKCNGLTYYKFMKLNPNPGLIFLSRINGELTDLEIPGFWKHAFLYIGRKSLTSVNSHYVIEAIGKGVSYTDLISSITSKDYFIVLECIHPKSAEINKYVVEYASKEIGTTYDYYLSLKQGTYYCSKLVWFSYDYACKKLCIPSFFNPSSELGIPTLSPSDIPDMLLKTGHFKIFFDSRNN